MLVTLVFAGCSDDDDTPNCKTCNVLPFLDRFSVEICDNGDNTVTIPTSLAGIKTGSEILDIPEGENFEDYDCVDIEGLIGDGFDFDTEN